MAATDTQTQLLDAAQVLVQGRGYNAFSYKDLAEIVGIRTASIHYHFPSKEDLGKALMRRYLDDLERGLDSIERTGRTSKAKLRKFIGLYKATELRGALCLCGSLASDRDTLPDSIQSAVAMYLERSEHWVADRIVEAKRSGEFGFSGNPKDAAASLLAGLQGALILSRARIGGPMLDIVERMFFRTVEAAVTIAGPGGTK